LFGPSSPRGEGLSPLTAADSSGGYRSSSSAAPDCDYGIKLSKVAVFIIRYASLDKDELDVDSNVAFAESIDGVDSLPGHSAIECDTIQADIIAVDVQESFILRVAHENDSVRSIPMVHRPLQHASEAVEFIRMLENTDFRRSRRLSRVPRLFGGERHNPCKEQ
jgi:hypothetical protein